MILPPSADPAVLRAAWALAVVAAHALLCAWVWRRERAKRARARRAADALAPAAAGLVPVLVAYASQTGFAEQLAWKTAQLLHDAGVPARLLPLSQLGTGELARTERALFIVSTCGEGDAPDNGARFAQQVMSGKLPLPRLHHAVLALGDSGYAHFCGFGRRLDAWLQAQGGMPLFARVELDNEDAATLRTWQHHIARLGGTADLPDWHAPAFEPWRLLSRRLLNEGSQGGPVFHLELEPAGGARPPWEAGDLVQVRAPADPAHPREYTISSVPADGRLHLLVRRSTGEDGRPGIASGWLTAQAGVGDAIELRVRAHAGFRIGDNAARPLLLVGNGTGFAGLRGHLRARASARGPACWLLFGERQSAHDRLFADEIGGWLESGVLAHADLVFSRDQPERRHVQHLLREQAPRVREWVDAGAAIYVCGSLEGMAGGVDAVLAETLGEQRLRQLADTGRYRRDVY